MSVSHTIAEIYTVVSICRGLQRKSSSLTGPQAMDGPRMSGQQLAVAFKACIRIPELGLQLRSDALLVNGCLSQLCFVPRRALTTRPPNVSTQQVSTLSGVASSEHDSSGSSRSHG